MKWAKDAEELLVGWAIQQGCVRTAKMAEYGSLELCRAN